MKRLKPLREARGLTQKELAEMLNTTQQTVARWESGSNKPPIQQLRDLATIFMTSVDDLLGTNPFSRSITTNKYYILSGDEDGFWGHIGVLKPNSEHTAWYAITEAEANRVRSFLRGETDEDWLVVRTLMNRLLAMRPSVLDRIWLLDDACDVPSDWHHHFGWNDYQGLPAEVYRAIGDWAWQELGASSDFEEQNSKTLQEIAIEHIKEAGLSERPEDVRSAIFDTIITTVDGREFKYEVDPEELWSAVQDLELGFGGFISLMSVGSDFETFFPNSKIVLIDMPLHEVAAAAKNEIAELEAG